MHNDNFTFCSSVHQHWMLPFRMALQMFNEMDFDRLGKANNKKGQKTLANYHFFRENDCKQQVPYKYYFTFRIFLT